MSEEAPVDSNSNRLTSSDVQEWFFGKPMMRLHKRNDVRKLSADEKKKLISSIRDINAKIKQINRDMIGLIYDLETTILDKINSSQLLYENCGHTFGQELSSGGGCRSRVDTLNDKRILRRYMSLRKTFLDDSLPECRAYNLKCVEDDSLGRRGTTSTIWTLSNGQVEIRIFCPNIENGPVYLQNLDETGLSVDTYITVHKAHDWNERSFAWGCDLPELRNKLVNAILDIEKRGADVVIKELRDPDNMEFDPLDGFGYQAYQLFNKIINEWSHNY